MLIASAAIATPLLARLAISETVKVGQSAFSLEFVRWRRKPRWLPVARSKLYRVPPRREQCPDEKLELQRLHNNYKTQLRSVRQYLREECKRIAETSTADHIILTPEQEEAEFQKCLLANDEWNQASAAVRDARLAQEREERKVYIKGRLELAAEREAQKQAELKALIEREIELSKTWITRERLDEAIEHALANPVDYNFAIDMDGNIYRGRTTVPSDKKGEPIENDPAALQEPRKAAN